MSALERRWFLTILRGVLPTGGDPALVAALPAVVLDEHLQRWTRDLWAHAPGESRLGVRAATWLLTWLPVVWRLKLRPFYRLSLADQAAFLTALGGSRVYVLREIANLFKVLAGFAIAGRPEVHRLLAPSRPAPAEPP